MKKFLETAIKNSVENTQHKGKKMNQLAHLRDEYKQKNKEQISPQLEMYPFLSISN